jgi:hypothetical protein
MVKYVIIHNKHEGCYDFQCYQDEVARIRLTSITINPPKIFMFDTREEAQDFFEEYINDVDCIDIKCRRGEEVEHVDYCTCGIIELDSEGEPILFYNKKNQIFLMEHGPQLFLPNQDLKNDIRNLNLTNKLIRKCKSLGREQRKRYIELGKYCEECNGDEPSDEEDEDAIVIKEKEKAEKERAEKEKAQKEKEQKEKEEKQKQEQEKPTQVVPVEPEKKKKVTKKSAAKEDESSEASPSDLEKKKKAPRKTKATKDDKQS